MTNRNLLRNLTLLLLSVAAFADKKPFQIADLPSAIVEIAIGWGHACARADNGSVWCWGRNDHGTLGDGSAVFFATLPVEVRGLGQNVVQLASNASHTCARKDDGTLWCWGSNYEGQLGDGTTTDRAMPVQVQLPTRVRQVAVSSEDRTCAVLDDGTAWCWGNNDGCELGDCNGLGPTTVAPPATSSWILRNTGGVMRSIPGSTRTR